jgi:hypothetical protein
MQSRSTNILPNSKVSQPFPTEDTTAVSTIEYDPRLQGGDVGSPCLMDPLLILAEVAVSSPSNSMNCQTIQPMTNNNITPSSQPLSQPTRHPMTSGKYIEFSQLLNIDSNPQICPITSDIIPVSTDAICSGSKWLILATMLEFEYKKMSTSEKSVILMLLQLTTHSTVVTIVSFVPIPPFVDGIMIMNRERDRGHWNICSLHQNPTIAHCISLVLKRSTQAFFMNATIMLMPN